MSFAEVEILWKNFDDIVEFSVFSNVRVGLVHMNLSDAPIKFREANTILGAHCDTFIAPSKKTV